VSIIMEGMGSKKRPRPRRSFAPEFKAEIVELCQRGDRSVGRVAKDFDLTETAVREWLRQAERDTGERQDGGLTSSERDELAALRRENRQLLEDVGILSVPRLSSRRRPGELLPVHRGGEGQQPQRQTCV
jgi:transposase